MSLVAQYSLNNKHRLPAGYTPLAYLESTGTQYINTGLTLNRDSEVICLYIVTKACTQGTSCPYGAGLDTSKRILLYVVTDSSSANQRFGNKVVSSTYKALIGEMQYTKINKTNLICNGTTVATFNCTTNFTCDATLTVFKPSWATSSVYLDGRYKIYNCVVKTNDIMLLDLIPCKKDNGTLGMFDCVNQTFYGNDGTGTFIGGPEVVVLPEEYLQVEYLLSDGKSNYINITTGLQANDIIELKCSINSFTNNSQPSFLGAASKMQLYFINEKLRYWTSDYIEAINPADQTQLSANTRYNITCKIKNTISSWYLFTYNQTTYPVKGRCEGLIVTRSSNKILHYVPCYKKSDGTPGMYDLINKEFKTNSGAGEFLLGPTVIESSRQLEYDCSNTTSGFNCIPKGSLTFSGCSSNSYDATTDTYTFTLETNKSTYAGITLNIPNANKRLIYHWNESYTFSCDIKANQDIKVSIDYNTGVISGSTFNGNDNYGSVTNYSYTLTTNTWKHITFGATNNSSKNTNHVGIYDYSTLYFPAITSQLTVQVKNPKWEHGTVDTSGFTTYNGLPTNVHYSTLSPGDYGIGCGDFDTNKSYIIGKALPISNGSVSFWRKGQNTDGWLLFSDSTNKYICASDSSEAHWSSGAGNPTMYIDGNLTPASKSYLDTEWHHYVITGINMSTWTDLRINAFNNFGTSWNRGGYIKDIRFYDHILQPNEITTLYLSK